MRFLNFLISQAPTPESEPPTSLPPINLSGLTPISGAHGAEVTEAETAAPRMRTAQFPFDLEDAYTVIEYVDAQGDKTIRRITMRRISESAGGLMLFAICHERRAPRTFRCDRIRAIADEHGELIEFKRWFAINFGVSIAPADESLPQIAELKTELRPALILLVATAKADSVTRAVEVDVIQQYIETEALILRRESVISTPFTAKMAQPFEQTIRMMNPQRDAVIAAVLEVSNWPSARQGRLYRTINKVIAADNILHPDELEFVNELNELREQHDH